MAYTETPNKALKKPTIGTPGAEWPGYIAEDLDKIDTAFGQQQESIDQQQTTLTQQQSSLSSQGSRISALEQQIGQNPLASPDAQNALIAGMRQSLVMAGANAKELENLGLRKLRQGTATITQSGTRTTWLQTVAPFVSVALSPALPDANYAVHVDVLSVGGQITQELMATVGAVRDYDRQNNGFKIGISGNADNVSLRWTLFRLPV